MLPSLYIKNYRNLKELTINSLGRINLIAGRNNTGKSSVLEAISIYANRGSLDSILQILESRGEYVSKTNYSQSSEIISENTKALFSLIYGRKGYSFYDDIFKIKIGSSELQDLISLGIVQFKVEEKEVEGRISRSRRIIKEKEEDTTDFQLAFEVRIGAASSLYPLSRSFHFYIRNGGAPYVIQFNPENNQFIRTNNIYKETNNILFDNIALTDKEQYVIDALRIIEPRTERIAFIDGHNKIRTAVVKLSGESSVIPIGCMGDGVNRIFTIILALVNSSDGYLLIDEFENGLHYTVQDQLWETVFKLATDLDIQVFATTHSNDCIASFTRILNKEQNRDLGKYIRLDNIDGMIKEVTFTSEELDIANNQDIEIR